MNPYSELPSSAFWKTGVTQENPYEIHNIYKKKFDIKPYTQIATAGSCFGQYVGKHLKKGGYKVIDEELAPPGLSDEAQQKYGFSIRLDDIKLSNQLKKVLSRNKRYKVENTVFNGDDYEIIFSSHKKNRSLIDKYAKNKKLKIQRIGKILKKRQDSCILKGNKKFRINKNLGYTHQF